MRTAFILAGVLAATWLHAAAQGVHIELKSPGTLAREMAQYDNGSLNGQPLFVSGPMNAADFETLREQCGKYSLQCVNLEDADIEGKSIPAQAFCLTDTDAGNHNRTNIVYILLPDDIQEIGDRAFFNSDLHWVNFPLGLEKIGEEAFGHTLLRSVVLPAGSLDIGDGAFSDCAIASLTLPEDLRIIPPGLAKGSSLMRLPNIDNVEIIGQEAFSSCGNLRSIALPEGVIDIKRDAFNGCVGVEEIELPSTLTYIGAGAFIIEVAPGLRCIKCKAETPPVCEIIPTGAAPYDQPITPFVDYGSNMIPISSQTPVYVPVGTSQTYHETPGWDYFQNYIETDDFDTASTTTMSTPADKCVIYADAGRIIVESSTSGFITITFPDGRMVSRAVTQGLNILDGFAPGLYIVNTTKLRIH